MNAKKILALLLGAMMLLSLAACGAKDNDKQADMSGDGSAMTGEPKTAEEALALHKELLERENALLSENAELWEKVFMEADKGMAMIEDGKNYGDFLLDTVEAAKEQFTDKEYEWLKESATEISNIENKLTELEEKYPEIMQKSMDGDMSMPAGSDTSTPPDDGSMQKFPAFEGKDLDGNRVKSDELYLLHHGRHLCTSRLLGTGGFGKRHERDVQPPRKRGTAGINKNLQWNHHCRLWRRWRDSNPRTV